MDTETWMRLFMFGGIVTPVLAWLMRMAWKAPRGGLDNSDFFEQLRERREREGRLTAAERDTLFGGIPVIAPGSTSNTLAALQTREAKEWQAMQAAYLAGTVSFDQLCEAAERWGRAVPVADAPPAAPPPVPTLPPATRRRITLED